MRRLGDLPKGAPFVANGVEWKAGPDPLFGMNRLVTSESSWTWLPPDTLVDTGELTYG